MDANRQSNRVCREQASAGACEGKVPSDIPALKPYSGKPAVRNFRGGGGNNGIIRRPFSASILLDSGRCEGILGIACALDRLIQQALHHILQPLFDPGFSESSYGFRPGRNAQQAVNAARGYVAEGRRWTVDLDLEKFFDRGEP